MYPVLVQPFISKGRWSFATFWSYQIICENAEPESPGGVLFILMLLSGILRAYHQRGDVHAK
jgi:hypothetical protein